MAHIKHTPTHTQTQTRTHTQTHTHTAAQTPHRHADTHGHTDTQPHTDTQTQVLRCALVQYVVFEHISACLHPLRHLDRKNAD
jgi:hypothetical protein